MCSTSNLSSNVYSTYSNAAMNYQEVNYSVWLINDLTLSSAISHHCVNHNTCMPITLFWGQTYCTGLSQKGLLTQNLWYATMIYPYPQAVAEILLGRFCYKAYVLNKTTKRRIRRSYSSLRIYVQFPLCYTSLLCVLGHLTLTLLYITKRHKNYLQNTQHVVLRNRPTLSIGTERLACLNNPRGVQLGTLA